MEVFEESGKPEYPGKQNKNQRGEENQQNLSQKSQKQKNYTEAFLNL